LYFRETFGSFSSGFMLFATVLFALRWDCKPVVSEAMEKLI